MYFKRNLFDSLYKHAFQPELTILTGARQTGKSTLIKELAKVLSDEGHTVIYNTLEEFIFLEELNSDHNNLLRYIPAISSPQKTFVILDEIQYLNDPSRFLKFYYDTYSEKIKIIATGSSAFYIDIKFKDSLAGRKKIFHLHTLSFPEFLHFKKREDLEKELSLQRKNIAYKGVKENELKLQFAEYITFGGYPAVVLKSNIEDKIELLSELKNSFLKKDIQEANITQLVKFYQLTQLLSTQIGQMLNRNEYANTLSISNKTVENYIYILQKSFHVSLVSPFFSNLRSELTKMPKLFFNDLGLRNSLINNFENLNLRHDKGELLENYAFIRISEKLKIGEEIHHWRTQQGNEVDFILQQTMKTGQAFEIKYSGKNFIRNRYKKFNEVYPDFPLTCLCFENVDKETFNILKF